MKKDSRIFITGASGLVGSYLARTLLKRGYTRITGLKREDTGLELLGDRAADIQWITSDITSPEWEPVLSETDFVFHCAALISHHRAHRRKMFDINVRATERLVNGCLSGSVKKLITIGSVAALHRHAGVYTVDPDSTFVRNRLSSDYGWTKHLAEMEVWRGVAEGLSANVVSPAIILGSGKWQDGSSALFRNVWHGVPYYPRGGNGFVDVRDVAALAIAAMESPVTGKRILAVAENLTYRELFGMMAEHLGVKAPDKPLGDTTAFLYVVLRKLQSLISGRQDIVTMQSVRIAQHRFAYSNDRSKTLLDFEYRPIEQTIRETAKQFLEAANEGFKPMRLTV